MLEQFAIKDIKLGEMQYMHLAEMDVKDHIHIVFAIDDNYIQQCAVTMMSILSNTNSEYRLNFHILNSGLKSENINKLNTLKNIQYCNINYIDVSKFDLSKFPQNRKWISAATYYRLYLAEVLPNNIDKCIYMDCDMIAEEDISILWNYDVENYLAGVVEDEASVNNNIHLCLNPNDKYFNAGLILFNMKKLREINLVEKSIEYFLENEDKIKLQDQDILNGVLAGKCLYLPLRWNIHTPAYMREENRSYHTYFDEREAILNPGVVHFTGAYKPWLTCSMHPLREEYQKYLELTNWKEDIAKYIKQEKKANVLCIKKNWNLFRVYILGALVFQVETNGYSFIERIFSLKNSHDKKYKIISIIGFKFYLKRRI